MPVQGSVQLTNLTEGPQTYGLQVVESTGGGVAFTVPGAAITLAPGASTSVTVTMAALKGAATGPRQAVRQLSAAGQVVTQALLFSLVK